MASQVIHNIPVRQTFANEALPDKRLVFFIDVDNTLLDNDRVKEEIRSALVTVLGAKEAEHFWQHHDSFRSRTDLVDFPAIIREYCREQDAQTCDVRVGNIFRSIKFAASLYPQALHTLQHLHALGTVLIFSEGDAVYQKMKIEKSGIAQEADGILLYAHKLKEVPRLAQQYQHSRVVFIDDRDDKLAQIKALVPTALTIVVCQGHYCAACRAHHTSDRLIARIGELCAWEKTKFYALASSVP